MNTIKRLVIPLLFILFILSFFVTPDIELSVLKEKYELSSSKYINVDGIDVHYCIDGLDSDTLPLILIHGTGASLHTFDSWVSILKSSKKIVRLDLPAFGLTGPFMDNDYSIQHYVSFIDKFLQKLGINSCILAGNSLGGHIAWEYTIVHHSKIQKLILIDPSGLEFKSDNLPLAFELAKVPILNQLVKYITPKSVIKKSVEDVYSDKSKVTEQLVDRYYDLALRPGNREAFLNRIQSDHFVTTDNALQNIYIPTLILWGNDDRLIPVSTAKLFSETMPNDTLIILKNCGHVPMEECPTESATYALDFLRL